MISRNALYDFVEDRIAAAVPGDALFEAESFRSLKKPVDEATKVVRVDCTSGRHCLTDENVRKELNVQATIQCLVTPESDSEPDLDAAIDESFEMSRELFVAIAGAGNNLNGFVCDTDFQDFETGDANLGSVNRGCTYMDGTIGGEN